MCVVSDSPRSPRPRPSRGCRGGDGVAGPLSVAVGRHPPPAKYEIEKIHPASNVFAARP